MNIGVQISLGNPFLISFGCIPRSGIAESCGDSVFHYSEKLPHYPIYNGHNYFASCQQCTELPFLHIPCQHLFMFLLLNSHSNEHEMVSHCGFALCFPDSHIEHLFICLSVIYLSSLEKSFVHFFDLSFCFEK